MADIICLPCKHLSKHVKATVWCLSCDEALCEQCCNYHKILKVTKDHEPIAIEDYETIANFLSLLQTKCEQHPEKQIQYRCPVHNIVLCMVCKGDHLDCTDVQKIDDGLSKAQTYSRIQIYSNDLEQKILTMKTFCDRAKLNIEMLDSQNKKFLHKIIENRKDIDASLEKLHVELTENFDSTLELEKRKLEDDCKMYIQTRTKWQRSLQHFLKIVQLKPLSHIQLFLALRHIKYQNETDEAQLHDLYIVDIFESCLDVKVDVDISDKNNSIDITDKIQIIRTLKPDVENKIKSGIFTSPNICDSANGHKFTESSAKEYENTALPIDQSETFRFINKHSDDSEIDPKDSKQHEQGESPVSKTEDQKASNTATFISSAHFEIMPTVEMIKIQCMKHLPNGKFIIGEFHQSLLLIYEKCGLKTGEIRLDFPPQSIAIIDDTRVAVTCEKCVVLANFESLIVERSFYLEDDCFGITYVSNLLVVNCRTNGLVVLSGDGVKRTRYPSLTDVMQLITINAETVACVKKESKFVYFLNIITNVCMYLECSDISGATSIALDSDNNLYVSCDKTNRIYFLKFGSDKFEPILSSDNEIKEPQGIDIDTDALYVVCPRSVYIYSKTYCK